MLAMNTQHADFSEAMELLCTLPTARGAANDKALSLDFGMPLSGIYDLAVDLSDEGVDVEAPHTDGGACFHIARHSRNMAKALANDYWRKVYGR